MLEKIIAYIIVGVVTLVMSAAATYPLWADKLDEANGKDQQ